MNGREPDLHLPPAAPVDPKLLAKISDAIVPGLAPVRPLPPHWILAAGMIVPAAAVAIAGAMHLGLNGIHRLSGVEAAVILTALAGCLGLAAAAAAAAMVPGARRPVAPLPLIAMASALLAAIFAVLYVHSSTAPFVPQGIACLKAGLLDALPAAILVWLVLRRGFVVDPVVAGAAVGALAGLAGVLMLELHCPLLEAPHAMVWHVAVIPISGACGALAGTMAARRGRR